MYLKNSLYRFFFSLSHRVGEGWGEGCCGYAHIVRPLTLSLSRKGRGNLCLFFAATVGLLLCLPLAVSAHPMGNFSINHFSALEIYPPFLRAFHLIDQPEIPTFQEMQDHGLTAQLHDLNDDDYQYCNLQHLQ